MGAEKQRPATSRFSILFGTRHRYGTSYEVPGVGMRCATALSGVPGRITLCRST